MCEIPRYQNDIGELYFKHIQYAVLSIYYSNFCLLHFHKMPLFQKPPPMQRNQAFPLIPQPGCNQYYCRRLPLTYRQNRHKYNLPCCLTLNSPFLSVHHGHDFSDAEDICNNAHRLSARNLQNLYP